MKESKVITYYIPLEECHRRYGKPGEQKEHWVNIRNDMPELGGKNHRHYLKKGVEDDKG